MLRTSLPVPKDRGLGRKEERFSGSSQRSGVVIGWEYGTFELMPHAVQLQMAQMRGRVLEVNGLL